MSTGSPVVPLEHADARHLGPDAGYAQHYFPRSRLGRIPQPVALIEQVLTQSSYALLSGRGGTYKSYVALDWALCVATGIPYNGRPVQHRKVLYMAAEGGPAMDARVRAWEARHNVTVSDEYFVVLNQGFSFYREGSDDQYEFLRRWVEEKNIGLVVIDTLRRVSGGADENGSSMGVVVDKIINLREASAGCAVLVVAHTGKNDKDTRGFSGIEDDADTVWRAKVVDGQVVLTNGKSKYSSPNPKLHLRTETQGDNIVLVADNGPVASLHLSDSQRLVLPELFNAGTAGCTVREIIDRTGIPPSTAAHALKELGEQGKARRVKNGRPFTWFVVEGDDEEDDLR